MPATQHLSDQIAALFHARYREDEPGAAVIAAIDGNVIYRNAFGLANVEHRLALRPESVFRLASVTKQFTAVAILMLVERGQLQLTDPLSKFFPEYAAGAAVTIAQLLSHTGGIPNYTSLPDYLLLMSRESAPDELINLFKHLPLEFTPGDKYSYSNSGYTLLGAIIEAASGQSYADFIQTEIFSRLGMARACYDSDTRIIAGRAYGYQQAEDGVFQNAPYLHMSVPYAAGALAASVDDLLIWDNALYAGVLLKPQTLQQAFQATRLNDGSSSPYGFGWFISNVQGEVSHEHSGGINGFRTHALRLSASRVFVAVLTNKTWGITPEALTAQVASLLIGRPYCITPIVIDESLLPEYVGAYQIDELSQRVLTLAQGNLASENTKSGYKTQWAAVAKDEFIDTQAPLSRIRFIRDNEQRVTAMELHTREGVANSAVKLS